MDSTKILGMKISSSLKWNDHIDFVTSKARKRIFLLSRMLENGFDYESVLDVYCKEIRSILEYCCVVYDHGLTQELDKQLESVQALVLRLLARHLGLSLSYMESCIVFDTEPLCLRRENQIRTFIKRTLKSSKHADMFSEKGGRETKGARKYQEYKCYSNRMFVSPKVTLANKL